MKNKQLATFNIAPELWEAFKNKCSEQNSNASAEIIKFINKYLDNTIDTNLDNQIYSYIDNYIDDKLKDFYSKLNQAQAIVNTNLDTHLDSSSISENFSNAELARHLKIDPATVSRWATGKRKAPENLGWKFNSQTRRWERI